MGSSKETRSLGKSCWPVFCKDPKPIKAAISHSVYASTDCASVEHALSDCSYIVPNSHTFAIAQSLGFISLYI